MARVRIKEALATIYDYDPPRCPECKANLAEHVNGKAVHKPGCKTGAASAARREALRERLAAALRGSEEARAARAALREEKENEMASEIREQAEGMTAPQLKTALKEAGITGFSKMKHAELVAAYVKAMKPKRATNGSSRAPREPRVPSENQVRVPNPIEWVSDDGTYSGKSPSANWNGSRWQIGKYLAECGYDKDEAKAALANAKEKLDNGAKSVQVLNVKIRLMS